MIVYVENPGEKKTQKQKTKPVKSTEKQLFLKKLLLKLIIKLSKVTGFKVNV